MQPIKTIKDLSFEKFREEALQIVKDKQHLNLIEDWERYIIFKDFQDLEYSYSAYIFIASEVYTDKRYSIEFYQVSYIKLTGDLFLVETYINRDIITVLATFENIVASNPKILFSFLLDKNLEISQKKI